MTTDTPSSFPQLGLSDALCQTLAKLGYEQPSSIQQRSIPPLLEGRDLLGIAQTGTGKTAAFALPLLSESTVKARKPAVLVLTPTRELCIQVAEAFESYAEGIRGLKILPIYGGQDMSTQLRQLKKGAQIIVGTPGRVMDHMRRKTLQLEEIQSVVLDEADEMLRMGFIEDVEWILEQAPDSLQLALFSATMPSAIKRIATKYLKDPVEVRIESATKTVDRIEQNYLEVNGGRKFTALNLVLETEKFDGLIVFARTKTSAQELAQKLEIKGYRAASIHGDLNQRQRELCIRQLRDAVVDIVVATDVAARGIDVPRITHVINYDIPYDGESYIHRIGRTGRAGRSGKAILFVTPRERRMLKTIERTTGQPVAVMKLPSAAELKQIRAARFAENIKSTLDNAAVEELRTSLSEVMKSEGLSYEELALALCFQSQLGRSLAVQDSDLSLAGGKNSPGKKGKDRDNEKPSSRRSKSERASERENIPMDTYKLAVGRDHSVRVGDVLGAVANELGIESRYIGEIQLEPDHSLIELPKDMPKDLFQQFRKIRIRNYPAKPEMLGGKNTKAVKAGSTREAKSSDSSASASKEHQANTKQRKPRKRPISDGGSPPKPSQRRSNSATTSRTKPKANTKASKNARGKGKRSPKKN